MDDVRERMRDATNRKNKCVDCSGTISVTKEDFGDAADKKAKFEDLKEQATLGAMDATGCRFYTTGDFDSETLTGWITCSGQGGDAVVADKGSPTF